MSQFFGFGRQPFLIRLRPSSEAWAWGSPQYKVCSRAMGDSVLPGSSCASEGLSPCTYEGSPPSGRSWGSLSTDLEWFQSRSYHRLSSLARMAGYPCWCRTLCSRGTKCQYWSPNTGRFASQVLTTPWGRFRSVSEGSEELLQKPRSDRLLSLW